MFRCFVWCVRFASFELISGGITRRREMHVVFQKNKCGHWRIKKREKWIDQGEEFTRVWLKENEKWGGAFPAGKLIRDHFPNFILFLPSLFLSLNLFCFFAYWNHFIPTVKHCSVQMTAVEQLKHKSERGWFGDLYNRYNERSRWEEVKVTKKMGYGNKDWG